MRLTDAQRAELHQELRAAKAQRLASPPGGCGICGRALPPPKTTGKRGDGIGRPRKFCPGRCTLLRRYLRHVANRAALEDA